MSKINDFMHNTQTKPDFHQDMIDWGRDIQRQTDSFLEEVEKGYASEAADYLRKFHFPLHFGACRISNLQESFLYSSWYLDCPC